MFIASVVCVGFVLRSGATLRGEHTPIAIMEYWRWWVVHLWVEGSLKYLPPLRLLLSSLNLGLVTRHYCHCFIYYFRCVVLTGRCSWYFPPLVFYVGTTTPIMAIGASFSALEVVPLVVLGYEGYEHWILCSAMQLGWIV